MKAPFAPQGRPNDGAAALVMVARPDTDSVSGRAVHVMAAASGADHRAGAPVHNAPVYATSGFTTVAGDLYRTARITPADVGVIQSYENFTGGVLMALVEHGLFRADEANDVLKVENLLAPHGRLPLNTSGGNLAECYMHGLGLVLEAVRQVRGTSTSQAQRHDVALVTGGPMVTPVSSLLLGSSAVV